MEAAPPTTNIPNQKESAMSTLTKLACPLTILTAVAFASAPAHAQYEGAGNQMAQFAPMIEQLAPMLEQFAPMMETMTRKIGKRRMSQMMQMVGPMMSGMMPGGGDSLASPAGMPDMRSLASLVGDGSGRYGRARHK
jgi:phage-related minor tail protein